MEHLPTLDALLIHLPGITALFANTGYSTAATHTLAAFIALPAAPTFKTDSIED